MSVDCWYQVTVCTALVAAQDTVIVCLQDRKTKGGDIKASLAHDCEKMETNAQRVGVRPSRT